MWASDIVFAGRNQAGDLVTGDGALNNLVAFDNRQFRGFSKSDIIAACRRKAVFGFGWMSHGYQVFRPIELQPGGCAFMKFGMFGVSLVTAVAVAQIGIGCQAQGQNPWVQQGQGQGGSQGQNPWVQQVQDPGNGGNGAGNGGPAAHKNMPPVDERVKNQYRKINEGFKSGALDDAQAHHLKELVAGIEQQIRVNRAGNNGQLKPEVKTNIENALNQSFNQIRTAIQGGTTFVESDKALGPEWSRGPDGAQNPRKLLSRMKTEERRELRQEKQANEQTLENQQLDYERQMMVKLGGQRKKIQQQKGNLQDIRKEQGAN